MAADAIISANFATFLQTIARNPIEHQDLTTSFLATILDRFIQEHPPNFDQQSKQDLKLAIQYRFGDQDMAQPTDILAALYLMRSLGENNPLTLYIQRIGPSFSADEDTCRSHLRTIMANIRLDEERRKIVQGGIEKLLKVKVAQTQQVNKVCQSSHLVITPAYQYAPDSRPI